MGPTVKGGWLAASVLVTRGVVARIRHSYTGAYRWGEKGSDGIIREFGREQLSPV